MAAGLIHKDSLVGYILFPRSPPMSSMSPGRVMAYGIEPGVKDLASH